MKVINWISKYLEESLLFLFSVTMVVVTFLQVFMRYVVGSSLSWSEELSRYCFIWLVFIAISYGVKHQKHIKMDILLSIFKEKGNLVFGILANILFLIFGLFILVYGIDISVRFIELNQTSPVMKIPIGFVYLAAPVGMGLTVIRIIQNIIQQIKLYKCGSKNFEMKKTS